MEPPPAPPTTSSTQRVCTGCGQTLPLAAYRPKGLATQHYLCRPCERLTAKKRHRSGPSGVVARKVLTLNCAYCTQPVPPERLRQGHRTCTRACLCLSVGLPADFDPTYYRRVGTLSARAEHEIRVTLESVILAAVAGVRT